jgi:hypothetical protein
MRQPPHRPIVNSYGIISELSIAILKLVISYLTFP